MSKNALLEFQVSFVSLVGHKGISFYKILKKLKKKKKKKCFKKTFMLMRKTYSKTFVMVNSIFIYRLPF